VLQVISLALAVFMLQKVAQFGQDTLLAGPALRVSQELRRGLFARLQRLDFGVLEKPPPATSPTGSPKTPTASVR
jgi:ATP-binding cassette subfamily B protein